MYVFINFSEIPLIRQLSSNPASLAKMIVTEDEWIPFRTNKFDAAISCLCAHWIENLKGKIFDPHAPLNTILPRI